MISSVQFVDRIEEDLHAAFPVRVDQNGMNSFALSEQRLSLRIFPVQKDIDMTGLFREEIFFQQIEDRDQIEDGGGVPAPVDRLTAIEVKEIFDDF